MPEPGSVGRFSTSHARRSRRARQLERLQAQARPRERPAVGAQPVACPVGRAARPRRRPRGRWRSRSCRARATSGRQRVEHVLHAPVVGPEVVAPVGDAVRLVDHEQPDRGREQRAACRRGSAGCSSRSGLISSRSTVSAGEPFAHAVPLVAVGAVDRVRAQAEPLRGGDLVAHQREQRADDQRRAGAGLAQQRGRDEVDGGLAPARALHAQHAGAVDDDVARSPRAGRGETRRPTPPVSVRRRSRAAGANVSSDALHRAPGALRRRLSFGRGLRLGTHPQHQALDDS